MTPFAKSLITVVILAITAFFLAPVVGLGAGSLATGIIIGGIIAGSIVALSGQTSSKPAKASIQHRAKPATTGIQSGDSETLFVGNLAFRANRHSLVKLFSEHGTVNNARIVTDRNTRKPKGYGFVEVAASEADNVIAKLDGAEFYGRELKVSRANKRD